MIARIPTVLLAAVVLASCSPPAGPPLTVSDLVVLEPLPGPGIAAAYLDLHNRSERPITIVDISSPQFSRIEIHETVIENDVARMRPLAALPIDPASSVTLSRGGKHLMLFGPRTGAAAGTPVTLEFRDDAGGLISISATIRSRSAYPE